MLYEVFQVTFNINVQRIQKENEFSAQLVNIAEFIVNQLD